MPSKFSSVPVGGNPPNSPLMTLFSEYLVTTVSPSAICSSMVKSMIEKASRISVTARLKSSRVGPCPGSRARSTKSGLSSSSITTRFPLACSSRKRRTSALFSSTDTEQRPPRLKPTLCRKAHQSQTMVHLALLSGTLGRSIKPWYHDVHVPARGDKQATSARFRQYCDSFRIHRPLLVLPRVREPFLYGTLAGKRGADRDARGQVRRSERQDDSAGGGSRPGGGARAAWQVASRRARTASGSGAAGRDGDCAELPPSRGRSLSACATVVTFHRRTAPGIARVPGHAFCRPRVGG